MPAPDVEQYPRFPGTCVMIDGMVLAHANVFGLRKRRLPAPHAIVRNKFDTRYPGSHTIVGKDSKLTVIVTPA